jgi:N-acetylglucosaminyl-diphospho-decaprenol L-rhamnosyltransferase
VVIVSHGSWPLLERCLRSLRAHPPKTAPMTVSVVDSGSPDDTPDRVAAEFPEVHLARRENVGFSVANNVVLNEVIESFRRNPSDGPAVLLLNPDTEIYEGTLDSSLSRLRESPDVGMVGCKLVTEDGSLDHACKRSFPTPLSALAHFTGIGRKPGANSRLSQYRASHLGDDEAGEVDAVNGAYMMVRPQALIEVGGLDEGYWLYMEDLDWCHRFWDAGWKVFYDPSGVALHVKGGSSPKRRRPKQEIAFHRGMGRFYRRFEAPSKPGLVNLAVYAGIWAKLGVSLSITGAQKAADRIKP